jgi:hypothetical protein
MKTCLDCEQSKPADLNHFHKNGRAKDGLSPYCIPCHRARNLTNYYKRKEERKREAQVCVSSQ